MEQYKKNRKEIIKKKYEKLMSKLYQKPYSFKNLINLIEQKQKLKKNNEEYYYLLRRYEKIEDKQKYHSYLGGYNSNKTISENEKEEYKQNIDIINKEFKNIGMKYLLERMNNYEMDWKYSEILGYQLKKEIIESIHSQDWKKINKMNYYEKLHEFGKKNLIWGYNPQSIMISNASTQKIYLSINKEAFNSKIIEEKDIKIGGTNNSDTELTTKKKIMIEIIEGNIEKKYEIKSSESAIIDINNDKCYIKLLLKDKVNEKLFHLIDTMQFKTNKIITINETLVNSGTRQYAYLTMDK